MSEPLQDGAAPDPGAAARGEHQDEAKAVDFRGLTLELPVQLPGSLIFDIAELETATGPGPVIRILRSMIGDEQTSDVRQKMIDDKVVLEDAEGVLVELLNTIFDAFGVSSGESSASPDSSPEADGATSRPTSSGSTDSTSAPSSTPPAPAVSAP